MCTDRPVVGEPRRLSSVAQSRVSELLSANADLPPDQVAHSSIWTLFVTVELVTMRTLIELELRTDQRISPRNAVVFSDFQWGDFPLGRKGLVLYLERPATQ